MPSNLAFRIGRSDSHRINSSNSNFRRVLVLATSDGVCSWPLVIWVVAIGGVSGLISRYDYVPASGFVTALVVAGSAIPMFAFIFTCWHVVLRRLTDMRRIIMTLVVFFIGGLLRVSVIAIYIFQFPYEEGALGNIPLRMVAYALFMETLLLLSTYVVAMSRRHLAKTESVVAQRVKVDQLAVAASDSINHDHARIAQEVQDQLEAELRELSQGSPEVVIERTSQLAVEIVRPMSHQLAREVPRIEVPEIEPQQFSVSWGLFWREVHFERFLRPWWFCVPVIFLILISEYYIFSGFPLVGYLFAVPMLAVALVCANLIIKNLGRLTSLIRYVTVVIVLAIASTPAGLVVAHYAGDDQNQTGILSVFILESVVLTLLGMVALGLTDTFDRMDKELDALSHELAWTSARGQGVLWYQNGRLAQALHGPVQSELHVALHKLRESSSRDAERPEVSAESAQEVTEHLMKTIPSLLQGNRKPLALVGAVEESQNLWRDQSTIDLVASSEVLWRLERDTVANSLLLEICQEAISNAVRHGHATQVDITITTPSNDSVMLEVVDNGSGGWSKDSTGFGMARLQECAVEWSLDQLSPGARLVAVMPIG